MNWNDYRRGDGSIDLEEAFYSRTLGLLDKGNLVAAMSFVYDVESIQHIDSRQVAALVIAQALHIARTTE